MDGDDATVLEPCPEVGSLLGRFSAAWCLHLLKRVSA